MSKTNLKIGDRVAFRCHIFGELTGTINNFMRCLTNGQKHAIVKVNLPGDGELDCCEPLINLKAI